MLLLAACGGAPETDSTIPTIDVSRAANTITTQGLMRHISVLSHDSLEGRAPARVDGARGRRGTLAVAKLDGADPALHDEWVVVSAHWDHWGRDSSLVGDQICNGAMDNASGTAALLEMGFFFQSDHFESAKKGVRALMEVGWRVTNARDWPKRAPTVEFKAARDCMLAAAAVR